MDYKKIIDEDLIEKVYLYSYKKLNNKADAEDMAQDILTESLIMLHKGAEIHSFYSWFWTLAHNRYCAFLSKRSKSPHTLSIEDEAIAGTLDSGISIEENLIIQEEISELNYAISRLSASHRQMVIMFYLKEMKISDIAGSLNIPAGTVKRRLFDMRTNLKKGFEKMNNVGKSAYAPAKVDFWGSGFCPFGQHDDLIIKQILIVCRDEGMTLNEIADEIGVAPVYIEDRLRYPLECGTMKSDSNGKYLTNICMIPEQAKYNADYKTSEIYSAIGPEIDEVLNKKKDYIQSLDFHGNKFDYAYLKWLLYLFITGTYGSMASKYNEKNWEGKVAADNGKNFRLSGWYTLPDEVVNRDKQIKQFISNNMGESFEHNKYGRIGYVNWFRNAPFSNRDSINMVNAGNAPLVFRLIENDGITSLTDVEEEQAANLISKGAIVKDGDKLNVMIPFMSAECEKKIKDCFEDLLQPLVEKYTDKISRMIDEIILPYVRDDLIEEYAHWILPLFLSPLPYVYYWAINEGKTLAIPDDYAKSAAGVYMSKK
jgi:RNA polymerase sigma factor (sigma-70 family)